MALPQFNSFDSVVNLSIKYQLSRLERCIAVAVDRCVSGTSVLPISVEFIEAGGESYSVIRQTADFIFGLFGWQGCRCVGSFDLITSLPPFDFKRYSVSFFIDNPTNSSTLGTLMDHFNCMLSQRIDTQLKAKIPNPPKLTRDPQLNSCVSQRVCKVNPVTMVTIDEPPVPRTQPLNPENIIEAVCKCK